MHLHHGYWISGEETKERAQIQLIERLARLAGLGPGNRILDVGSGFGGSNIYLAKEYDRDATRSTISPIQRGKARQARTMPGVNAKILRMDPDEIKIEPT